jgi:virulence factor Mce-like protein
VSLLRRSRSRLAGNRAALGFVALLVLVFLVAAVDLGLPNRLTAPGGTTIRARFANASQLGAGAPVRVGGVDAGRVKSIGLDAGGRSATVTMLIYKAGQPVYQDARAAIRWRTLLGGNFAVDLKRGTPASGRLGSSEIPESRTSTQVELEDVTSFDQGGAKAGLRMLLAEVPTALSDHQAPAQALGALGDVAPSLTKALSAIRGEHERDLRPLVSATARTVRALDTPADSVHDVVQGAAVTMNATATRDADLRSTIQQAADVQPSATATLARLNHTLSLADPLVGHLRAPASQVAPTVKELRPTVVAADRLLDSAPPLLHSLRPAASSLAVTAGEAVPLLTGLTPSIDRLANRIFPDLAVRDPVTKLTTYQIVGPTIASLDGAGSTFDSEGHLFRFPALGGERALSDDLPCSTFLTDPEKNALIECKSLQQALATYFGPPPPVPAARNGK